MSTTDNFRYVIEKVSINKYIYIHALGCLKPPTYIKMTTKLVVESSLLYIYI